MTHDVSIRPNLFLLLISVMLLVAKLTQSSFISQGDPYQPLKPHLTVTDLNHQPWSDSTTILSRHDRSYSYHNYTVDRNETGHQLRWVKRSKYIPDRLARRGFGARPIGEGLGVKLWTEVLKYDFQTGTYNINLCYDTEEALQKLHSVFCHATGVWNIRLDGWASIRFRLYAQVCPKENSVTVKDRHIVVIQYRPGHDGSATLGATARSSVQDPLHWVKFDHEIMGTSTDGVRYAEARLMHELGHVLGLQHEHQRPDASDYVRVNWDNIPGHQGLINDLASQKPNWPANAQKSGPLTLDDFKKYAELSQLAPWHGRWQGGEYAPYSEDDDGDNILGKVSPWGYDGDFDRDSIMLFNSVVPVYEGGKIARTRLDPRLARLSYKDGSAIPRLDVPSNGDMEILKLLYPRQGSQAGHG